MMGGLHHHGIRLRTFIMHNAHVSWFFAEFSSRKSDISGRHIIRTVFDSFLRDSERKENLGMIPARASGLSLT